MSASYGIVSLNHTPLRREHRHAAEMISQLVFGELFKILEEKEGWYYVQNTYDKYEGWIPYKMLTRVSEAYAQDYLKETHPLLHEDSCRFDGPNGSQVISRCAVLPFYENGQINIDGQQYTLGNVQTNMSLKREEAVFNTYTKLYLGTPYLWGGRHFYGTDCSGYAQQVLRAFGVKVLRDSSQQVHEGTSVSYEDIRWGDLVFFHTNGKTDHVAIALSKDEVIHASGRIKIDILDEKGIKSTNDETYVYEIQYIKRMFELF